MKTSDYDDFEATYTYIGIVALCTFTVLVCSIVIYGFIGWVGELWELVLQQ